ncbi:MAG TPA: hypothetical protein DCP11_05980 [Microbacteriaceae bacterium]|jgi:hypothetical protein|nr:hypothetical protein [Microbacteriaceae bacterium]
MDRSVSTTIVIAVIVLALVGMVLGWRGRQKRQSHLPRPLAVPTEVGRELLTADVFYVATTIAGDPLNRIAVAGLGFRGRATVTIAERGVVLGIAGEPEAFIPRESLRGIERATWTIDRVVEPGGLVLIAWTLGSTDVDSYLRVAEPADPTPIIAALERLLVETQTHGSEAS